MKHTSFEAFCSAMENQDDSTLIRRAAAFWQRLGDIEAADMAIDSICTAKTLNQNPAATCLAEAKECGHYTETQIQDAALYASRS